MPNTRFTRSRITIGSLLSVGLIAACVASPTLSASASSSPAMSTPSAVIDGVTVKENPALRAELPSHYLKSGVLVYATNADGPPRTEVNAQGAVVGLIPDLVKAVAVTWGLKAQVEHVSFDAEIPGVQSSRFDIAADTGDFNGNAEVLNYVDYLIAGSAFLVPAGNPKHVTGLNTSLCGLTVATNSGTVNIPELQGIDPACKAAGKPDVKILSSPQAAWSYRLPQGARMQPWITRQQRHF